MGVADEAFFTVWLFFFSDVVLLWYVVHFFAMRMRGNDVFWSFLAVYIDIYCCVENRKGDLL